MSLFSLGALLVKNDKIRATLSGKRSSKLVQGSFSSLRNSSDVFVELVEPEEVLAP